MGQINGALQHLQKEHTSLSANSSLMRPVQETPAKLIHQEALQEIEFMKGKAYSEVLFRLYSHLDMDSLETKVRTYINRLANVFDEYGCSDQAVIRVLRRCRESEFKGTAYMPLPDEGALIRIINEVNAEMVTVTVPYMDNGERLCTQKEIAEGCRQMMERLGGR